MELYVIESMPGYDNSSDVIGISDSIQRAREMITEYYGEDEHEIIDEEDVRDSGIEFILQIKWNTCTAENIVDTVVVRYMHLNEI